MWSAADWFGGVQIERFARAGVKIHARSVLLQGISTIAPEGIEPRFAALRPVLAAMRACCAKKGLFLLAPLLGAVLWHRPISG